MATQIVVEAERARELGHVKIDGCRHQDEAVAGITMPSDGEKRLLKNAARHESWNVLLGPCADIVARGAVHHGMHQGALEIAAVALADQITDERRQHAEKARQSDGVSQGEACNITKERISTGDRPVEIKENEAWSRLAWMFEVVHASLPIYPP